MRGDTSSKPIFNYFFNTTRDFLNFLNNGKYDFMLKKDKILPEYNFTKTIAIDIQFNHPDSNLIVDFFYELIKVIKERDLLLNVRNLII